MEQVFNDFINACNELDEMALEGFFGEDVLLATEKREDTERNQFLYETLLLWTDGVEQTKDQEVKEYIKIFFRLYLDAYLISKQEAIDIMSAFWYGTTSNPELECMSSYTELSRLFTETKNLLAVTKFEKVSEKKQVASSLANTYSKGVEFIGKTLTICIILQKLIHKENYNFYKIYNLTIHKKIEAFKSYDSVSGSKILSYVNKNLRNADSHLSLSFNPANNQYFLKKKNNGKIIIDKIPIETMVSDLVPGVGAYIQAFVYSGVLFTLAHDNQELFVKSVQKIYG